MNGKIFDWVKITSGVPEGALLAPLLISLFINDLPEVVSSSECIMYADDVKLYRRITSLSDCTSLQNDLNNLCKWSSDWRLKLNPQKCQTFTITLKKAPICQIYYINTSPLRHVAEVRDLGIILDAKLTFSAHVSSVVTKANRSLGLLIRSFQTSFRQQKFDRKALLTAYCTNIRSILEYGSVIWSGAAKSHSNRLERVQHKFLMWLACRTRGTDRFVSLEYPRLLTAFNISTLEARRVQFDLIFLRNIFAGRISSSFLVGCFGLHVPQRATRQVTLFHVPFARV